LSIVKNIYEELGIEGGGKSLKSFYRKKIKESFGDDEKLSEVTAANETIKDIDNSLDMMTKRVFMLKKVDIKKEKNGMTHFLKEQFENPFEVGR